MERREPGLFGTLFAFGSPLLVGLLVVYEFTQRDREVALTWNGPSSAYLAPQPLDLVPLACVVFGWLGLSIILQVFAWFMNGRGTLMETLETIGRMVGILGAIEGIRLAAVLNGLNEWAAFAWFSVGSLLVLGWSGRSWGKLHLLRQKETVVITVLCFYAPALTLVAIKLYPGLRFLL